MMDASIWDIYLLEFVHQNGKNHLIVALKVENHIQYMHSSELRHSLASPSPLLVVLDFFMLYDSYLTLPVRHGRIGRVVDS